jgi:hypothetical protein
MPAVLQTFLFVFLQELGAKDLLMGLTLTSECEQREQRV